MKNLDKLNEAAHNRFEELKRKQLGAHSIPIKKKEEDDFVVESTPYLAEDKFYNMFTESKLNKDTEDNSLSLEDNLFKLVDAFGLSSRLSLAISMIALSKHDRGNLSKAIQLIKEELDD